MDPIIIFETLQVGVGIVRALMQTSDPTPEQLAWLESAESIIKIKLDQDLAAVARTATI